MAAIPSRIPVPHLDGVSTNYTMPFHPDEQLSIDNVQSHPPSKGGV